MATTFGASDDLKGATFDGVSLQGARFVESDLSGVVMRGVDVSGMDLDAPWLPDSLLVNGVNVAPFVEATLNERFPGRASRRAESPEGLRAAWAELERTWASTLSRAASLPAGAVDVSVAGEWSFALTLRHLVLATDMWLGKAILGLAQPFHPLGKTDGSLDHEEFDKAVFATEQPSYEEVLETRAGRVAMVRDFLAEVTPELLAEKRNNPHAPDYAETVRSCLHVILEEEWEHHRFAVRDLDAIEAGSAT